MRRKKNKQMEGQISIFDLFSSFGETNTTEEDVSVSSGVASITTDTTAEAVQTSIFDFFSADSEEKDIKEEKTEKTKEKRNFCFRCFDKQIWFLS